MRLAYIQQNEDIKLGSLTCSLKLDYTVITKYNITAKTWSGGYFSFTEHALELLHTISVRIYARCRATDLFYDKLLICPEGANQLRAYMCSNTSVLDELVSCITYLCSER